LCPRSCNLPLILHHTNRMTKTQEIKTPPGKRGALARPLDALVFLLPLLVFYEVASWYARDRVIAFHLLRMFFELFGRVGMWAPALAVVVILLATHAVSGEPWKVHWSRVGWMYVEAVVLAIPLLVLNQAIGLAGLAEPSASRLDDVALSVGAGIYEELVFRLILISVVVLIGVDMLRRRASSVAVVAVVLSSLVFAAHHHQPIGTEPFDALRFGFRAACGAYLAIIFWFRGYGLAAGCHASYNIAIVALS